MTSILILIVFFIIWFLGIWHGLKIEFSIGEFKISYELYALKRFFKRK